MIIKSNTADSTNRLNLHEARTDQEAKAALDRLLQVDQAGPRMRPRRRPSRAPKEPTTFSEAREQRAPNTTAVLMEVSTKLATMERLAETTTKTTATVLLITLGRTGVLLKLVCEMNMGRYVLGVY
jgi:hypothetical protein